MNRRLRHILTSAALACAVIIPFQMLTAFAASAKISFSDPNSSVGQEFNVSVKISADQGDLGAADVVLSYDPAYIEFISGNNANGGAGSVRLVGTMDSDTTTVFSYNLKFKAIQAGNSSISVASYEVYDKDTQAVDVTKVGSSTVKVAAPSNYSKEAGLSSMKVSPGSLSPAFSPDVTSYTVNVGKDVDKLLVSAAAKDGKAKVVVSGDSGLKTGANTVVCKVTAEDGQTTKSYKITVNKSETAETEAQPADAPAQTQGAVLGELKADIDGTEYAVAASFDPAALPEGFAQSTINYSGNEIMSGTGNGISIIYLQDAEGNGGFFIYDEASGALSPYVTIDVTAKSIIVLPVDDTIEVPEGFAETTIQLNGNYKVKGWVWKSDEEQKYCVVYGMNENGEKGLYRYDIAEKTFQRYFEDPVAQNKYDDAEVQNLLDEYHKLLKDYNFRFIIMIALLVVCLILIFIIVNMLIRRKENNSFRAESREEAPTPRKRREMEQERVRGRGHYEDREPDRRQGLDVYETRTSADARVGKETVPTRGQKSYVIRHEDDLEAEREVRRTKAERPKATNDMQETLRQRELDREERARLARERLLNERREDERRRNGGAPEKASAKNRSKDDDDDFEFMDLD